MAEINWAGLLDEALGTFTLDKLPPTLELPALPHAVSLFVQKSNDPDASINELAKIIETDSGLTVELLKYVNSSFIGLRNKAKSISQTLTLLGKRQTRMHIVTSATQAAVRAKKSKLINQSSFWNSSLQKALFAREVSQLLKVDPDLAFAGALLQDYLLPVISNELYDTYLELVTNRDDHPANICNYEREQFKWDHAIAGACLARRWHLPDDIACCILFQHYGLKIFAHPQLGRSAVVPVALSAMLPDEIRQQTDGLEQLAQLGRKWAAFDLQKLAETVDEEHKKMGLGVRNSFPLAPRCKAVLQALSA